MKADVSIVLPVRIGDINYGGHLGHDRLISLLHHARIEFFRILGASESNCFGVGLIMRRLQCDYLGEAFIHDKLQIDMTVSMLKPTRFTLDYQITRNTDNIAVANTQMVAFNYCTHKVMALPEAFIAALDNYRKDKK